MFVNQVIACPHCRHEEIRDVAMSVNGARHKHYADSILGGVFQRYTCGACQEPYVVDNELLYLDRSRRRWTAMFPLTLEPEWRSLEQQLPGVVEASLAAGSPLIREQMFSDLSLRTVFGLEALREKVLCTTYDLDDVALEVVKLRLLLSDGLLSPDVRIRLTDVTALRLSFLISAGPGSSTPRSVGVPRSAYDQVSEGIVDFSHIVTLLSTGTYVDIGRVLACG